VLTPSQPSSVDRPCTKADSLSFVSLPCPLYLQAELEASAESGTTVSITLPDSGRQLQVAVGQDWVEDSSSSSSGGGVRSYFIKWVQDESGALAVLEVVPAVRQQQQQVVATHGGVYGSRGRAAAVAPVAC
jgi:hypothetical protein